MLITAGKKSIRTPLQYLVFTFAFIITGVFWAISSPIGSSPDDDFHLTSIWCSTENQQYCQVVSTKVDNPGTLVSENYATQVKAPSEFWKIWCWIGKTEISAKCSQVDRFELSTSPSRELSNNVSLYPKFYYKLMSFFVTDNTEVSVVIMRFVSLTICLILFLCGLALSSNLHRRLVQYSLAFFLFPFGIYFFASNNPFGLHLAGLILLIVLINKFFHSNFNPGKGFLICLIIVYLLVINIRYDSGIYISIFILILFIFHFDYNKLRMVKSPIYYISIFLMFLYPIISHILRKDFTYLDGASVTDTSAKTSGLSFTLKNLIDLPIYFVGNLGYKGHENWKFGLGWFDVPLPDVVPLLLIFLFCLIIVKSFTIKLSKPWTFSLIIAIFFSLFAPLILLQQMGRAATGALQPRYLLPFLVLIFFLVLLTLVSRDQLKLNYKEKVLVVLGISLASSLTLRTNIARYVSGLPENELCCGLIKLNLNNSIDWWWNIPLSPNQVWFFGSVSSLLLIYSLIFFNFNKVKTL